MSESWTVFFEMITSGALLSWSACLLVGCRFLAPDLAVAIGVSGLWIGWEAFRKLGLPPGPSFYGIEVLPGLVGTILVLLLALYARDRFERWRDGVEPPPPRSLDDRATPRFVRER